MGIGGLAGTTIRNAQLFEQLQNAHQRYRELFEESIDPIFITDWFGKISEANRQAINLSGFSTKELHRMSIDQLHQVNWSKVGLDFENLREEDGKAYDSLLHKADSGMVPIEVHVHRVEFEDADSIQWTLRDITERKELDALREDLTAMIYHDLRSPLGNIVSSLDLLGGMLGEDEASRSALNIAVNSTDRIQRLVNSLLDINRLESGQTVSTQVSVRPQALIQKAVDDVLPSAKGRQQIIETSVALDLPKVWVDMDMMRRVLINLLENAVKFSEVGAKIEIGAELDGRSVKFWVQDHGPGIAPSEHKRIFEKFVRAKGKGRPGGLGIGLAFCRIAVQTHGGTIWVESEEGQGAKFIFTLPAMDSKD
jgi:PAS domain S-box-containing protein